MGTADYQRNYWRTHPDYVERHKATQKKRVTANQVWLYQYLSEHPCVDCGESDPVVLEFDHVAKKWHDVTRLTSMSLKRIQEEIAKCEVCCANCHTRRTAQRANTIRWQMSQVQ
jgi:hypothetical protein